MRTPAKTLTTALCIVGMSALTFAGPPAPRHDGPEPRRDNPDPRPAPDLHHDMPGPRHDGPFHGDRDHRLWRLPGPAVRIVVHDRPYYYHAGLFYVIDNDAYVVVDPPMGAYVPVLPVGSSTIIVGDATYYLCGSTYFRRFGGGYIVVTRPVMTTEKVVETQVAPPPAPEISSVGQAWTVWITNPNGSKVSVVLRAAEGGQWIGPKGEYYDGFPTEEQLLPVYGLGVAESTKPAPVEKESIVLIKNPNGSKSKVVLKAGENGTWIGPRGEIYDTLPTEDQLRSVYGVAGPAASENKAETPEPAKP